MITTIVHTTTVESSVTYLLCKALGSLVHAQLQWSVWEDNILMVHNAGDISWTNKTYKWVADTLVTENAIFLVIKELHFEMTMIYPIFFLANFQRWKEKIILVNMKRNEGGFYATFLAGRCSNILNDSFTYRS